MPKCVGQEKNMRDDQQQFLQERPLRGQRGGGGKFITKFDRKTYFDLKFIKYKYSDPEHFNKILLKFEDKLQIPHIKKI